MAYVGNFVTSNSIWIYVHNLYKEINIFQDLGFELLGKICSILILGYFTNYVSLLMCFWEAT